MFGGGLQQHERASRIGGYAHAIEVHESEKVLGVGITGGGSGLQQRDRFLELKRAQRGARRFHRVAMTLLCEARSECRDSPAADRQAQREESGAPGTCYHQAVPYLVSTSTPIERRKSLGSIPPAFTMTA